LSGTIDVLNPDKPRRVLVLASNPTVSEQTGWPIGFWWAELTHPYWEFAERGYQVEVASPDGGLLRGDSWSDPRDESKYSADDLISLGFVNSPEHMKLVDESKPLADVRVEDYDAFLAIGGQGPMYTFYETELVHGAIRDFYEAGKPTAVICHGTCALLKTRLSDGSLLVDGKRSSSRTSSSGRGSSRSGSKTRQGGSLTPTSSSTAASSRTPSGTAT
jgi:putative intracellular protease/amidase